jgi:hypothetical protein
MTAPGAAAGSWHAWNTWDAEWPAAVVHLDTGAALRIGAYSASANRFTDFPWSAAYRLGTHAIDGSEISIDLSHAGSTVRLRLTAGARGAQGPVEASGPDGSAAAIRDVLGWNSVWDPVGRRVYTASTRAWIARKFGGFGVWQIDGFLHAILAAHLT